MKKSSLFCLLFWFLGISASLPAQPDFAKADSIARTLKKAHYPTYADLARKIGELLPEPRDRTRAIFAWIAGEVAYDFAKAENGEPRQYPPGTTPEKRSIIHAEATYRKSKGVCMDYSMLFNEMCRTLGIECQFVPGLTRQSSGLFGKWYSHAWNAVKLDGQWQLLDVTWAAGYSTGDGKFRRRFSPGFFCTKPELFVLDHYPDDEKWQLLKRPVDKKQFKKLPTVNYALGDWAITDFEPKDGTFNGDAERGRIRLKFASEPPAKIYLRRKGKMVEGTQRTDSPDGWTTLTFPNKGSADVEVFVGTSNEKLAFLAGFEPE